MGDNSFAPSSVQPGYGTFVVQNITTSPAKVVRIFNAPINPPGLNGNTRDLLALPGVAESDIRVSLLKGEIRNKILTGEITIIASDIDLLQFNLNQMAFLQNNGVSYGMQIGHNNLNPVWYQDIQLVGVVNGSNATFTIPSGTFIQNSQYKITVYLNGVKQNLLAGDYSIAASTSAGYDTVIFAIPPEASVLPVDVVTADYWVSNTGGV